MRVLMCIWGFGLGGAERVAVLLANALAELGCEVRLLVSVADGHARGALDPRVDLVVAQRAGQLPAFLAMRENIAAFRPDVVLSHQTPRNLLSILAHRTVSGSGRRAVIVVEHGEMKYNSVQAGPGRRAMYLASKLAYPFADLVVSVSENIRLAADAYIAPLRIRSQVLDNPVIDGGSDAARAQPPTPVFDDHALPLVIGMGRLVDQKNWPLAIAAFARLQEIKPSRMVIFGEGPERARLESLVVQAGLADRVKLPGATAKPLAEMRAADVMILASKWEGLPTVAIEALFCGLQIVSTANSSGIAQILDDGRLGWIVPDATPEALADACAAALDSPKPRAMLELQAETYRHTEAGKRYLAAMDAVLERKCAHATPA